MVSRTRLNVTFYVQYQSCLMFLVVVSAEKDRETETLGD
jgi:hypothetical protein